MQETVEDLGSDYLVICYNNNELKMVDQATKALVDIPERYTNYTKFHND